jgi:hypothetical protein
MKETIGRPKHRWENSIKMDIREIYYAHDWN